ncbi:unnamed protein product [Oikopleura dioica]|uniref:Uncharacterized protein n=1 Tax=Oikopleura dioica TaxID=34765 RepID=E4XNV1_OIKDI|nr:unnamed protein product [Oikopleura dioica]
MISTFFNKTTKASEEEQARIVWEKFSKSRVPPICVALQRGIHDEKKMFFRRTIVIRYVLNHIALFVFAFLVAIFSLEFGLAMSQNITIHDIMKDTGTWFSDFFLQHLDDHIFIIFDSIAIVFIASWILVLGHMEFGSLKREDWQRFSI